MGTLVGGNSVINNYRRIKDNKKGINKDGGFSNQVALVIMLTLYPLGICFSAIVTTLSWPVVEDNFVSSGVKESLYSDHKEGRSERESNLDEQESIEIVRKWWSKRSSIFAPTKEIEPVILSDSIFSRGVWVKAFLSALASVVTGLLPGIGTDIPGRFVSDGVIMAFFLGKGFDCIGRSGRLLLDFCAGVFSFSSGI